jgi:sporulation protein YlmC with PRC-barrel domain
MTEQQTGQRERRGQQQPAQTEQAAQRQPGQLESGASAGANPLYDETAGELRGKEIVDAGGKDLGKVDKVVLDSATGQPYVVLAVGGFLGLGDETITLPLSDMTLSDDKLVIPGRRDEDQLKQRPRYKTADYVDLQDNMTIARQMQTSGHGRASATTFEQLDRNHDGYLSPAEFSAFESGGSE